MAPLLHEMTSADEADEEAAEDADSDDEADSDEDADDAIGALHLSTARLYFCTGSPSTRTDQEEEDRTERETMGFLKYYFHQLQKRIARSHFRHVWKKVYFKNISHVLGFPTSPHKIPPFCPFLKKFSQFSLRSHLFCRKHLCASRPKNAQLDIPQPPDALFRDRRK